ncbi:DNA-damage-inducible SOS response protein [Fusobacterium necrophorum subsp. necrophorum]|nr:DNA-damage-inducible SOS response protein [Fusobacterium necrophorum subsp. necrophorum]
MPAVIAFFLGLSFLILQLPIFQLSTKNHGLKNCGCHGTSQHLLSYPHLGSSYGSYRLCQFGMAHGPKKNQQSMFLQISANILNIILDILFVHKWGMKVEGVAYATLISQCFSFAVGLFWIHQELHLFSLFERNS